jgi:hypothetical protein
MILVCPGCVTLIGMTNGGGKKRTGNVRITWHWGAFTKPLLQWKNNNHYIFMCVCACARMCVCVCVWERERESGCGHTDEGLCLRACSLTNSVFITPPYCHLLPPWLHRMFRYYLITSKIFGEKVFGHKMYKIVFSIILFKTFLVLRRIQWDIDTNVTTSSCKVPVIFFGF